MRAHARHAAHMALGASLLTSLLAVPPHLLPIRFRHALLLLNPPLPLRFYLAPQGVTYKSRHHLRSEKPRTSSTPLRLKGLEQV